MLPHQALCTSDLVSFHTAYIIQNLEDTVLMKCNNHKHCCLPSKTGNDNRGDALDW